MKGLIIFLGGAVTGGLIGWAVSNAMYKKKVAEVRNIYADLTAEAKEKKVEQAKEAPTVSTPAAVPTPASLGYSSLPFGFEAAEHPTEGPDSEPYVIAPERFEGDPKYQKHYLVYSVDEDELYEGGDDTQFTVYDEHGEPEILSTMDILGEEFMEEALDYSGDRSEIMHIRNESLQMDFEVEILR